MKTLALAAAAFGFVLNVSLSSELSQPSQDVLIGQVRPTDGDSLRMGEHRIRLYGIDSVESAQSCDIDGEPWACGRAARKALERLTEGRTVICQVRDMDRERYVSVCSAGDVELNHQMVRRGWAVAYTDFTEDYVDAEAAARTEQLALWRSEFERPQIYRARLRAERSALPPQTAPDPACTIKGNVSRSGTRIYHMPGQADYGRTRINTDQGEHWFCSPEEAEAAGWRRAQR